MVLQSLTKKNITDNRRGLCRPGVPICIFCPGPARSHCFAVCTVLYWFLTMSIVTILSCLLKINLNDLAWTLGSHPRSTEGLLLWPFILTSEILRNVFFSPSKSVRKKQQKQIEHLSKMYQIWIERAQAKIINHTSLPSKLLQSSADLTARKWQGCFQPLKLIYSRWYFLFSSIMRTFLQAWTPLCNDPKNMPLTNPQWLTVTTGYVKERVE